MGNKALLQDLKEPVHRGERRQQEHERHAESSIHRSAVFFICLYSRFIPW